MPKSIEQMAVAHREQEAKELEKLDRAQAAIQEATRIEDVKTIRDQARAVEVMVKRERYGAILQQRCSEIRLRAQRRAGEMLQALELKAGRPGSESEGGTQTLSDLKISKNESSRWQRLADIPEQVFDEAVAENPSERALLRLAPNDQPKPTPTPEPEPVPEPNQPVTRGYWVLTEGEGLTAVRAAAGSDVVALLDADGVIAGYFVDQSLAEQIASILNAM